MFRVEENIGMTAIPYSIKLRIQTLKHKTLYVWNYNFLDIVDFTESSYPEWN